MFESLSPRGRRLLNSLGYAALVALVIGLGYLTFRAVSERRQKAETTTEASAEPAPIPLVDFDSFSTRRERSSDSERLNVSLRLRVTAAGTVDCYVFVLARNDHVTPKLWAVWPTQGPGGAVSTGGHFRGSSPASGQPVQLTSRWTRISASVDHPSGQPPFDEVMVYVVSPKGEILLARPFAVG